MDSSAGGQTSFRRKKMTKQLTAKRDDTPLHSAARNGNLSMVVAIFAGTSNEDMQSLLCRQNHAGETALYVACEYGYLDVVSEMTKHYDASSAGIKAKNGYDALHIAAKQGDADVLKILMNAIPELVVTADSSNTTALHTAAALGHADVVELLLAADASLVKIARSNGKTPLHSAARNGHAEVVKRILAVDPMIAHRPDKKGQTALHMAVKGQSQEAVAELLRCQPSLVNSVDSQGSTALHVAARKGRPLTVRWLLDLPETELNIANRAGETALDAGEKGGNEEVVAALIERGAQKARTCMTGNAARELKQTVSDIKHEVQSQLEHTYQTRRRVQRIAKRLNKLHAEGLNNAINSTTVVAVLIATVAFAAIFTVPGQYAGGENELSPGQKPGEANIAHQAAFMIFFVFDSVSLFIALAVVVVQTSVVVIERKAKKRMMAVINKLMWIACAFISVSFLAISFVVVGPHDRLLAVCVTAIGAGIMVATLGTMTFWVVANRVESRKISRLRRSSLSGSFTVSLISDPELLITDYKKLYAI